MNLQLLCQFLLATLLTTPVQAKPHYGYSLKARDLVGTGCSPLLFGGNPNQLTTLGQACATVSGCDLTVTYTFDRTKVASVKEVHVGVFTSAPTAFIPPGQLDNSVPGIVCTITGLTATCTIPLGSDKCKCGQQLFLITHASVTETSGAGQTVYGGVCVPGTQGNCQRYWSITTKCECPVEIDIVKIFSTTSYTTITGSSTSSFFTSSTSYTTITTTSSDIVSYSTTESSTSTITSVTIIISTTTATSSTTTPCDNPSKTTITTTTTTVIP